MDIGIDTFVLCFVAAVIPLPYLSLVPFDTPEVLVLFIELNSFDNPKLKLILGVDVDFISLIFYTFYNISKCL